MKPNNKSIQVKTKNGTLQVRRLPDGFQVIAASNDLQVIHSMNLTDEAMMSLNFCVGYLVASEGLAKSEPKVAQVASEPETKFEMRPQGFRENPSQKETKTKPKKVTIEFINIRWSAEETGNRKLPANLVCKMDNFPSKPSRDSMFLRRFKCLPVGYGFRIKEGRND